MSLEKKKAQAKTHFAQRNFPAARKLLKQVCDKDSSDVEARFTLGIVEASLGNMADAARHFEQTLVMMPELAEAHFNLGKARIAQGQIEAGIAAYQRALQLNPNWPQLLNNLGNAMAKLQKASDAIGYYQQAIKLAPNYVEALINYSNTVQLLGNYDEAVRGYQQALKIKPGHPLALTNLGTTLIKQERYDEAIECCRYAAKLFPGQPEPIALEAKILAMKGEWEEANRLLTPVIATHPHNAQVVLALATFAHRVGRTGEAIKLGRAVLDSNTITAPTLKMDLHFELGRLYDRQKQYAEAFEQYTLGNALKPGHYDAARETRAFEQKMKHLTRAFYAQAPRPTIDSQRPIFIVGMPRSGTSLLEQILDSHPQITGAGELYTIDHLSGASAELTGTAYPESLTRLTTGMIDQLARRYLDKLDSIAPESPHVTDKMPQNFMHLGLIALLFPHARVLHCTREPLDTCLSIYFQNFASTMTFAKDLNAVGHYYRHYQQLMQHWRENLDIEMLDVSYEALTADQEAVTKEVLDFLGLPWDENCLNFHQNRRVIATASIEQVRQPIYRSSIQRWKNYEPYIQPLLKALKAPAA